MDLFTLSQFQLRNKSVKLPMTWNGKLYEGKMAGIDFTSAGPSINKTTSGRG